MEEFIYTPYKGGGGPTKEQADINTKALGQELDKKNILFVPDREYAKELWDGDDLNLKITHPKTKEVIYVGYDRWGFVSGTLDLDQDNLIVTVANIELWYNA